MSAIQRLIDRHAGEGTLDAAAELAQKDEALRLAREALQKIAKVDAPTFGEAFGRCVDIARAALAKATP